jgi:hypothetical protein
VIEIEHEHARKIDRRGGDSKSDDAIQKRTKLYYAGM